MVLMFLPVLQLRWESYSFSSFQRQFFFLPFYLSPFVLSLKYLYLSLAAATPGSSLPSRNSREAPPPVEMWLILSPNPSWLTAAAESPPPIMVVASVSARALATAIVPFARTGFSNTPSVRSIQLSWLSLRLLR